MNNCNEFFNSGKITIIYDGGAGSSGKGKLGGYISRHSDNWQFACNTFFPQAGHWRIDGDKKYFYQTLNSCAADHYKFEKLYIGSGSIIELPSLFKEVEENGIPFSKIGIAPTATILVPEIDQGFEQGRMGFDGELSNKVHDGTSRTGSTGHGVGSAFARKILRRKSVVYAKDVPELKSMICDVSNEIIERLENGQAGFGEMAQGYQLSLNHPIMAPFTTSRNVTTSQFMSDLFLPPKYAGQTIMNLRTYPIRINSNKYISVKDGRHLTWQEVLSGEPHQVYEGNSGPGYPDQVELSWDDVTISSGSPNKIMEMTSVTKLPRRVFTFSKQNVKDALRHNDTGYPSWISVNFVNYVDYEITGKRSSEDVTSKVNQWLADNLEEYMDKVRFLGTGAESDDTIQLE